ncbi:MAG TPA: sugar ABC transporter permease [Atribacteraceae bacterium]|nr:sugar ABC transporter permease [Atribacteraceae bacterium]
MTQQERLAFGLVGPAVLALVLIVGYPFLMGVYLSMTDSRVGSSAAPAFVGLNNFFWLARSPLFHTAVLNSLLYTFIAVLVKFMLGLPLAILLWQNLPPKKLLRGIILLPWVIPIVLSATAWKWIYDPTYSVINWLLLNLELSESRVLWFGSPWAARISVMLVNIWRGTPFFAINILAGLMTMPTEIYDAAKTDGAGPITCFFRITLPLLRPILAFVLLFSTVMTIGDFPIVYMLTRGGPLNSTHLLPTLAYQIGLITGNLGRGTAVALFIFPVLLTVVYFQSRLMRNRWNW